MDFTYQNSPGTRPAGVALTVQPGECVLLCGRSGCGKTTFSRLLNGLAPVFYPGALAGQCTAAGLAAGEAAIEDYVPKVGSVFQNPKTQYFNVDTTAELAFPCENSGLPPETIRARVAETARKFHIEPLMGRSVLKLSGGEKQQVAFATACMLGPKLLVLDEPTSNLDAAAITRMHDMVATMKQCGVTVVLAEHRLAWITDLVDRYFYFADGALTAQWTAAEFAALPPERLTEYGLRGGRWTTAGQNHRETAQRMPGHAGADAEKCHAGLRQEEPAAHAAEPRVRGGGNRRPDGPQRHR